VDDRVKDSVKGILSIATKNSKNDHVLSAIKDAINDENTTTITNMSTQK